MEQCLQYDSDGNIYPLPFGPTKDVNGTSPYADMPFCINPIEIIFLSLIGVSVCLNLWNIWHLCFEYSNIGKVRSRAKSFRYGDHRRSTLAVIFEPPSKFSNLVLSMNPNLGNTEMRTSKMAQLNNRISRVTWRTGSKDDQPDVRTGSLRSESV